MEYPIDSSGRPVLRWREHGCWQSAPWLTSSRAQPHREVVVVGDNLRADHAHRLASRGTAMLWRGNFRNARQLLDALKRRLDRRLMKTGSDPADTFRRYRQARAHRASVLGMVLIELEPDLVIDLPYAPDVRRACRQAFGHSAERGVISLQELLGVIGAYEWRRHGVEVPELGIRIHPHYGVFSPTRSEYVALAVEAPLPDTATAFDIGTGTGVLAALLARRGARRVVATDIEERAVACARDNVRRLGLADRVEIIQADMFPAGRADLVICNPPWLPATPTSPLEAGVYDRGGRMLTTFVHRLPDHLTDNGEAWLLLSDLAEQLGLRTRTELTDMFIRAGLIVRGRLDTHPRQRRARSGSDPLASFRTAETISLWRLGRPSTPG
ncbi:MAG: methyltransferase [Pseudonocardia sp.]